MIVVTSHGEQGFVKPTRVDDGDGSVAVTLPQRGIAHLPLIAVGPHNPEAASLAGVHDSVSFSVREN